MVAHMSPQITKQMPFCGFILIEPAARDDSIGVRPMGVDKYLCVDY